MASPWAETAFDAADLEGFSAYSAYSFELSKGSPGGFWSDRGSLIAARGGGGECAGDMRLRLSGPSNGRKGSSSMANVVL